MACRATGRRDSDRGRHRGLVLSRRVSPCAGLRRANLSISSMCAAGRAEGSATDGRGRARARPRGALVRPPRVGDGELEPEVGRGCPIRARPARSSSSPRRLSSGPGTGRRCAADDEPVRGRSLSSTKRSRWACRSSRRSFRAIRRVDGRGGGELVVRARSERLRRRPGTVCSATRGGGGWARRPGAGGRALRRPRWQLAATPNCMSGSGAPRRRRGSRGPAPFGRRRF